MTKLLGFHGVEAEKAEAMRRYSNRRSFQNILRVTIVISLLGYLWFPTLEISLQIAGDLVLRTGTAIITNHFFLFLFTNILVALIFLLSSDGNDESSIGNTEPDLYNRYTSNKQIVPAWRNRNRDVVTTDVEKHFKRTTTKKKKNSVTVREFRRTESARDVEEDDWGFSSEEFRLKVERFIMEQKKKSILEENDVVVQCQQLALLRASYGYSSC